ncbi:glycoside hydrolase family 108 protein [Sinorhizobium meliloti]|uniref:glycoside hydrolase family 108 protein n=1 Tax=Rhizobium meliloti TaxID=382 RepID=UPI003F1507C1
MARETLPVALELTFGDEGGYSNVKTDRGGPTKYGVTHATLAAHRGVKAVTAEQVRAMSREEATDIYRRSYWQQCGGDLLPPGLDYAVFDFGVNSGPARFQVASLQSWRVRAKRGRITGDAPWNRKRHGGRLKLLSLRQISKRLARRTFTRREFN